MEKNKNYMVTAYMAAKLSSQEIKKASHRVGRPLTILQAALQPSGLRPKRLLPSAMRWAGAPPAQV